MMKNLSLPGMLFTFGLWTAANAQDFYVNPRGNDQNPGTKGKPVASLQAAQNLVRQFKANQPIPAGGISVWIAGGTYPQKESLVLDEKDSGLPGKPVTWRPEPAAEVSISGGITLAAKDFGPVKGGALWKHWPKAALPNLRQVNLKAMGIHDYGQMKAQGFSHRVLPAPLELFFNNEPMTLARYPNSGYVKIGKVTDKGSVPRTGDKSNRGATFTYTDDRHAAWANLSDIWLQGTFNYGFADDCIPIANIDTASRQVKLARPHLYGVANGRDFQQYYALNIPDELDMPGEWYLDRNEGILYFWPPSAISDSSVKLSLLESPIVALEGASHVQLIGLTLEAGRGMGIYMERSNHNLVAGCTIRNVGTCGIFMGQGATPQSDSLAIDDYDGKPLSRHIGSVQNQLYKYTTWDRQGGNDNGIQSCDIYNTGSGGIYLSGGSKRQLIKGNNYADNCKIHDYNRRYKFTWSGINIDGCGNKIRHCEIFNSDWQGIYVRGNEHLFEYNNIHHVTLNSDDTSPWYIGRDPSDRGNVVQYNYFHDCGNPNRMNMGVYCDDSSTDVYVYGNVFSNMATRHGILFSNTGWDLVMKNNIVVNPLSHTAVISAHYYTWAQYVIKDMFGPNGLIRHRLEDAVQFRQPPYATAYPSLVHYLDPIGEGKEWEGMRSRGNVFSGNLMVGGPADPVELMGGQHASIRAENNIVSQQDPGFVDMTNGNFQLRPDAKVFQQIPGFAPVPFDKMGLYRDTYRK